MINVLFPMAGDGVRFGTTFKPLLDATEKKFIELAKEPFDLLKNTHKVTFYFIYRRDQEEQYDVESTLRRFFPNDTIQCCILDRPTKGPLETIQLAIANYHISGLSFVCDCDHAIPIINLLPFVSMMDTDVIIPTWNYNDNEFASWGKVKCDHAGNAISFYEKEYVERTISNPVYGMIGCYLFRAIEDIGTSGQESMSDLFPEWLQHGKTFRCIPIKHAEFFGTPEQLISFRFDRARKYTFFMDIDGTLFHLPKHVSYDTSDTIVLPGAREQLTKWRNQGHTIILTTGRVTARREKLIQQLHDMNIPYDQLVTGLASGPRIVVNDKKPYCAFHAMSQAIQLRRNEGIAHIEINETPTILSILKGGSFAVVYLIEKNGVQLVRKYIEKRKEQWIHYETLQRQYEDMKRWAYLSPGIVPTIVSMYESPDEYYFDMEYLDGYRELSTLPSSYQELLLPTLITRLYRDVYCFSKPIQGKEWLASFVRDKIESKYAMISAISPSFFHAINDDYIVINKRLVHGVRSLFSNMKTWDRMVPTHVSPIHGDLTLENILVHPETLDVKLIDPSGSRYVDPIEMDVAKLCQYTIAKYGEWESRHVEVHHDDCWSYTTDLELGDGTDKWWDSFQLSDCKTKGLFYACTYFLRMIPFLLQHSEMKALYGLIFAIHHLSQCM